LITTSNSSGVFPTSDYFKMCEKDPLRIQQRSFLEARRDSLYDCFFLGLRRYFLVPGSGPSADARRSNFRFLVPHTPRYFAHKHEASIVEFFFFFEAFLKKKLFYCFFAPPITIGLRHDPEVEVASVSSAISPGGGSFVLRVSLSPESSSARAGTCISFVAYPPPRTFLTTVL